jgi:hypothetical protein
MRIKLYGQKTNGLRELSEGCRVGAVNRVEVGYAIKPRETARTHFHRFGVASGDSETTGKARLPLRG